MSSKPSQESKHSQKSDAVAAAQAALKSARKEINDVTAEIPKFKGVYSKVVTDIESLEQEKSEIVNAQNALRQGASQQSQELLKQLVEMLEELTTLIGNLTKKSRESDNEYAKRIQALAKPTNSQANLSSPQSMNQRDEKTVSTVAKAKEEVIPPQVKEDADEVFARKLQAEFDEEGIKRGQRVLEDEALAKKLSQEENSRVKPANVSSANVSNITTPLSSSYAHQNKILAEQRQLSLSQKDTIQLPANSQPVQPGADSSNPYGDQNRAIKEELSGLKRELQQLSSEIRRIGGIQNESILSSKERADWYKRIDKRVSAIQERSTFLANVLDPDNHIQGFVKELVQNSQALRDRLAQAQANPPAPQSRATSVGSSTARVESAQVRVPSSNTTEELKSRPTTVPQRVAPKPAANSQRVNPGAGPTAYGDQHRAVNAQLSQLEDQLGKLTVEVQSIGAVEDPDLMSAPEKAQMLKNIQVEVSTALKSSAFLAGLLEGPQRIYANNLSQAFQGLKENLHQGIQALTNPPAPQNSANPERPSTGRAESAGANNAGNDVVEESKYQPR